MKIAILCGTGLDEFQQAVLKPIMNDASMEIVGAYIDGRPRPSLKKRLLKNLKRGRGGYMLVMLVKSRSAKKRPSVSSVDCFTSKQVPFLETQQPYAEEDIAQLQKWHPEVMVMLGGFGIVKEPLLSLAPQGILSYHHGDMRKYRGQPVGFWELYHHESQMGVTVQRLSTGVDKGTPIIERAVSIKKNDNVKTLCIRAMTSSIDMMHEALQRIGDPTFQPVTIHEYGPIYTLPNLRQYLRLQIQLLFRK